MYEQVVYGEITYVFVFIHVKYKIPFCHATASIHVWCVFLHSLFIFLTLNPVFPKRCFSDTE